MYRCTVYHGTGAICISIEIVQLRSGDGVALMLTLSLSSILFEIFFKYILAKKIVQRTVRQLGRIRYS